MKFYKNFFKRGKTLYIREHDNGKDFDRKIELGASVFMKDPRTNVPESGFTNIHGDVLQKMDFDTPQGASNFVKSMGDSTPVYGFPRFEYTKIASMYGNEDGCEYDLTKIKILYLDIETEVEPFDEYGVAQPVFPDWNLGQQKVNAISLGFRGTIFTISTLVGRVDNPDVKYIYCQSEDALWEKFFQIYQMISPDIVSGWNCAAFDLPYIVARLHKLYGPTGAKRLSPFGFVSAKDKVVQGRATRTIEIGGVSIVDYLVIYKKYRGITRESYKLDFIVDIELGDRKVPHEGSFRDFYTNPESRNTFLEYNAHDVRLIMKLEAKLRMIELVVTVAYLARVNFEDVQMNVRVWDVIIANYLNARGVQGPFGKDDDDDAEGYAGAFVKDPIRGYYEWALSIDAESLE